MGKRSYEDLGCTLDEVADALSFVDCDIRSEWVNAGNAIKAEFGEGGFDVWNDWSQGYPKYRAADAKAVWRSFRGRQVPIEWVFKTAISNNYKPRKKEFTAEEKARFAAEQKIRRAERDQQLALEAEQDARMQDVVARRAYDIWHSLPPQGESAYLTAKAVHAYGLRFVSHGLVIVFDIDNLSVELIHGKALKAFWDDKEKRAELSYLYIKPGCTIVPMVNGEGVLRNLQILFTDKKRFLKHGQKQGCYHFIGELTPAAPLCVAEGYATAATIHEATGWPVVVAFDAGNLLPVCCALRPLYPDTDFLICGDDDSATKGNPGKKAAGEAALQVQGLAVFPSFEEVAA